MDNRLQHYVQRYPNLINGIELSRADELGEQYYLYTPEKEQILVFELGYRCL